MHHVPQNAIGVVDNLPRAFTLDVRDKSHAAAVVLESRVVESVRLRSPACANLLLRVVHAASVVHPICFHCPFVPLVSNLLVGVSGRRSPARFSKSVTLFIRGPASCRATRVN